MKRPDIKKTPKQIYQGGTRLEPQGYRKQGDHCKALTKKKQECIWTSCKVLITPGVRKKRTAQNKVRWRTTVAAHLLHKEQRGLTEVICVSSRRGGGCSFKVTIYSMNHFAGCKIIFYGGLAGCEGAIDMGL